MGLLQDLILHHNELTYLQKTMFNGLESLVSLHIQNNLLETVPDGCFSDLINLVYLHLGYNKLSDIRPGMWQGLSLVQQLYLHRNNIDSLNPGDLDHLPNLRRLLLYGNRFTTISHTIFNPTVYPYDGHPREINIGLGSMTCDSRLCWLKQGERLGWITWYTYETTIYHPDCSNFAGSWSEIDLGCPENGAYIKLGNGVTRL